MLALHTYPKGFDQFSLGPFWPMLAAMRATPVETALSRRISKDSVITGYLDRMDQTVPLP